MFPEKKLQRPRGVSMIFGSLVLILVAVVAFGLGLAQGSNAFLVMSIGASLLAAVAIVLGARRAAGARPAGSPDGYSGLDEAELAGAEPAPERPRDAGHRRGEGTIYSGARTAAESTGTDVLVADEPERAASIPSQSGGTRHVELDIEPDVEE